ncbi:hypothetical protein Scani_81670 [Streptomyces caniferus]|uniref:Uncharacterized protein n=1 Tax=Streptomyces caniferus TaxID=285557 RepID=A0A640SKD9_9ACTN|nr:hypothetical protein [Streptomyces caniferus]GFE11899.1 hypothetical protein Scani_81670 [Streptomyces caniferus]
MFTLTSPSPQAAQARAAGFTASFAAGVSIPVGDTPQGIALTPGGARAYVANRGSNTVSVIDTATKHRHRHHPHGGRSHLRGDQSGTAPGHM